MTINEKSRAYGAQKSTIREISAYANQRKAEIGADKVFDFSLGNPSVPAPDAVRASIEHSLTLPPMQLHGYTLLPDCLKCERHWHKASTGVSLLLTAQGICTLPVARQHLCLLPSMQW